jgi:hypothetical protein
MLPMPRLLSCCRFIFTLWSLQARLYDRIALSYCGNTAGMCCELAWGGVARCA